MTCNESVGRFESSAPIDDDGVTCDPDVDTISPNDSSVSGRLGGDAYRTTGESTGSEADKEAAVDATSARMVVPHPSIPLNERPPSMYRWANRYTSMIGVAKVSANAEKRAHGIEYSLMSEYSPTGRV